MKIIICEEDYSYIEEIYSTLFNFSKVKGLQVDFNLTTRKPNSIVNFLDNDQADCYYISLDLEQSMSAIDLIKIIRTKNEFAIINVLSTDASKLESLDLNTYNVFKRIEKVKNSGMKEQLKKSLVEVFSRVKNIQ